MAGLQLLEGLQSSLIISKIPSVSHNRNTKGEYHHLFDFCEVNMYVWWDCFSDLVATAG